MAILSNLYSGTGLEGGGRKPVVEIIEIIFHKLNLESLRFLRGCQLRTHKSLRQPDLPTFPPTPSRRAPQPTPPGLYMYKSARLLTVRYYYGTARRVEFIKYLVENH